MDWVSFLLGSAVTVAGGLVAYVGWFVLEDYAEVWRARRGIKDVEDHANEGKS